ncbi:transposase [Idiomarina tyrosinivorans]|uniref:Transposase n=1 Tax=Idiomarina tyrosinivorans TaxID=1445662 RepID=A0A432ZQT6_9GAMM|nr:transposase [Idiomarina tyrosinivorans]RUO80243.1 transposase [Idiomarina tyrosinivorans]
MRNVRRYFEKGGYYFFTVNTFQRQPVLLKPAVQKAFWQAVRQTMETHPFDIEAWCMLPDHFHCVIFCEDEKLPQRWAKIKALTTRALPEFAHNAINAKTANDSRIMRKSGRLWQKSYFERTIRNDRERYMLMLYTLFNPVKHGYIENAIEWPYSTLRSGLARGFYPSSWRSIDTTWLQQQFGNYFE